MSKKKPNPFGYIRSYMFGTKKDAMLFFREAAKVPTALHLALKGHPKEELVESLKIYGYMPEKIGDRWFVTLTVSANDIEGSKLGVRELNKWANEFDKMDNPPNASKLRPNPEWTVRYKFPSLSEAEEFIDYVETAVEQFEDQYWKLAQDVYSVYVYLGSRATPFMVYVRIWTTKAYDKLVKKLPGEEAFVEDEVNQLKDRIQRLYNAVRHIDEDE